MKESFMAKIINIGTSRAIIIPSYVFKNNLFKEGDSVRVSISDEVINDE